MKLNRFFWLIAFLITGTLLYSHPHLFIKPTIGLVTGSGSVKGLQINWEWDKWWSEDVFFECDLNGDGTFNKEESQMVYDDFFIGIEDFDFFTFIHIDGKRYKIKGVEQFKVSSSSDGIVTYSFFVPLNVEAKGKAAVEINFDDATSYTAFEEKIPVNLATGPGRLGDVVSEKHSFYGAKVAFQLTF